MAYDYKDGKQRIQNILRLKEDVIEVKSVPQDESKWTYANGIKSWISAIFVDMRDSSNLFLDDEPYDVARIVRSYTSEIIEIMNQTNLVREIGIRGDCVFGVFSTPSKENINEIFNLTVWINTFIYMLNKLLIKVKLEPIKVGIGMSTSYDLVIKAGRKGTGINDKVWIGKALVEADRLSKVTSKSNFGENTSRPIAVSNITYSNIKEFNKNKDFLSKHYNGDYYFGNIIKKILEL